MEQLTAIDGLNAGEVDPMEPLRERSRVGVLRCPAGDGGAPMRRFLSRVAAIGVPRAAIHLPNGSSIRVEAVNLTRD
jgi:hypothetical protein